MKKCRHGIYIEVIITSHDIHIQDTKHSDNRITITKEEGEYLKKILNSSL